MRSDVSDKEYYRQDNDFTPKHHIAFEEEVSGRESISA
ncbi:IncF plasmid conjugative transfer pilus assembly protein TraK [Acetobacter orientalis]|uniref:IncF plasmid conjugative transfer pilus assembly protein TraK n=1 Tax=Acetobacter orientalis TaxID=146474 RepID=A0A2Z5ZHR0_9PROT|nr:IncF plasmid conjugative transfer pilus assembly protein TraK [Acetobacter orientalis]